MLYTIAAGMWSATGSGAAKNRAFSGVMSAPPASWASRTVPARAGTMLSAMRDAGMSQSDLVEFMMISLSVLRRAALLDGQRGREDDVVARVRPAGTGEWLEAGHVVSCLEAQAHAADAEVTAECAVAGEVVRGAHVQRAIVVAPRAGAEACKRADRHSAAGKPLARPDFDAEVGGEDVELRSIDRVEVSAPRPPERPCDGERRAHDPRQLRRADLRILEEVPLGAGGNERAAGEAQLPRSRLRRGRLGFRRARRKNEHAERAEDGERGAETGAVWVLHGGDAGDEHCRYLVWGVGRKRREPALSNTMSVY